MPFRRFRRGAKLLPNNLGLAFEFQGEFHLLFPVEFQLDPFSDCFLHTASFTVGVGQRLSHAQINGKSYSHENLFAAAA